jgi:tripartite-type tricarboxylate transporter receptor subunit TctC
MRLSSIRPLVLGTALALSLASQATADWPERPIQLIVPFPAGSATDIVARIIAPGMGKHLGQPIVVENRAGASGAVGAQAVASARPDGYTIGLGTTSTLAVAPALIPISLINRRATSHPWHDQ